MKKNYFILLAAILSSSICTYFLANNQGAVQEYHQP